jgi:hypothetical protein
MFSPNAFQYGTEVRINDPSRHVACRQPDDASSGFVERRLVVAGFVTFMGQSGLATLHPGNLRHLGVRFITAAPHGRAVHVVSS